MALALGVLLGGCVVAPPGPYRHVPPPPPRMQAVAVPAAQPVPAQFFYPERGQDEARQDRDRYECYRWAVRETGFDPGMTTVREARPLPPPPPARDGAPVVAGAATGAVLGAAVSGPRHVGESMVIGAIFGAAMGAAAQEANAQARERAYEQAQAHHEAQAVAARAPLDNFRRAMGACMAGRGYRVG